MSSFRKGILIALTLFGATNIAHASDTSDVVGLFANPGYVGSKAGEKTMTEAN